MYGQLKSTVKCLKCSNISITFDPFLTLALPIARPFKVGVRFIPSDIFHQEEEGGDVHKKLCFNLSIPLSKDSNIKDLKGKVAKALSLTPPG